MELAIIAGIVILIIIIIVVLVIALVPAPATVPASSTTAPAPMTTATTSSAPAAAVVLVPANKVAVAVSKDYLNNNGTVNGIRYCQGAYESINGDKNMICKGAKNTTTGAPLACNIAYGVGNGPYTYTCGDSIKVMPFNGNNGTVNGSDYCTGGYESSSGANKNMTCVYGKNTATGAELDCTSVYGLGGPYTYMCGS